MFNLIYWEMFLRNLFGRSKEPEIEGLLKLISRNSVIIDVGANRGTYTFPIHRKLRKSGLIYCFEPIPKMYDYLVKGFAKYVNVKIFRQACSDNQLSTEIRLPINGDVPSLGSASFVNNFDKFQLIPVECVRIDDLIATKVDFIKIDVEGYETFVLRGALKIVTKFKPIILVELDWNMGNQYFHDLKAIIDKIDYSVLALTGGRYLNVDLDEFDSQAINFHIDGYRNNFFLVPKVNLDSTKKKLSRRNHLYFFKKLIMLS